MKTFLWLSLLAAMAHPVAAAEVPAEFQAAADRRRAEIPLGGDFEPDPLEPALVAVGHGGRILLSRDDGRHWKQVFWGHPGSDHGPWATKAVTFVGGVVVVPVGWGAPTAWLASDDGLRWRHFTDGTSRITGEKGADQDPTIMPGTWGIAGDRGVLVSGGYMNMGASADLGKTITTFSLRSFKDDPRSRKLVTHHVQPLYCGDASGRFLALGNDRSKPTPVFGNLFASDDAGKSWRWMEPSLLNEKCQGYSGMVSNGRQVVILDASGENVFVSQDAGDHWEGPFATGCSRVTLSVVGQEFWLTGRRSRASAEGRNWRDLPDGMPSGKVVATNLGTLVSVDRQRPNILRSEDGGAHWEEVYRYAPETEHVHGAQGLRDVAFGFLRP